MPATRRRLLGTLGLPRGSPLSAADAHAAVRALWRRGPWLQVLGKVTKDVSRNRLGRIFNDFHCPSDSSRPPLAVLMVTRLRLVEEAARVAAADAAPRALERVRAAVKARRAEEEESAKAAARRCGGGGDKQDPAAAAPRPGRATEADKAAVGAAACVAHWGELLTALAEAEAQARAAEELLQSNIAEATELLEKIDREVPGFLAALRRGM